MAMTPEAAVKKAIRDFLNSAGAMCGAWHFSPFMAGYGRTGIPDFIGCANGKFFAIEAKAGDNQPTALQAREIDAIRRAGGFAAVVRESNLDQWKGEFLRWLES